jgi:hypothetical protein
MILKNVFLILAMVFLFAAFRCISDCQFAYTMIYASLSAISGGYFIGRQLGYFRSIQIVINS